MSVKHVLVTGALLAMAASTAPIAAAQRAVFDFNDVKAHPTRIPCQYEPAWTYNVPFAGRSTFEDFAYDQQRGYLYVVGSIGTPGSKDLLLAVVDADNGFSPRIWEYSIGTSPVGRGVRLRDDRVFIAGHDEISRDGFVYTTDWQGERVWTLQLPGLQALDLTQDRTTGDLYIVGKVDDDFEIAKVSDQGDLIWRTLYTDLPKDSGLFDLDIEIATDGNLYVAGVTGGELGDVVHFLYSIDQTGDVNWQRDEPAGTSNGHQIDIALDDNNSIYLASSVEFGLPLAGVLWRYEPNGDLTWVRYFNEGSEVDGAAAALDEQGRPWLIGSRYYLIDGNYAYVAAGYNTDGTLAEQIDHEPGRGEPLAAEFIGDRLVVAGNATTDGTRKGYVVLFDCVTRVSQIAPATNNRPIQRGTTPQRPATIR